MWLATRACDKRGRLELHAFVTDACVCDRKTSERTVSTQNTRVSCPTTKCSRTDGKFLIKENAAEIASVAISRKNSASDCNVTVPLALRMWAWLLGKRDSGHRRLCTHGRRIT